MAIQQLLEKLISLKHKDMEHLVFGAASHRYKLHGCLSDKVLSDFERQHSIRLPEDYRNFLQYAGNGGAGPAYGLLQLQEWNIEEAEINSSHLATPFPHSQAWNMSSLDETLSDDDYTSALIEREAEYFKPDYVTGSMRICHYGCAIYYLLVVSGPESGHIWVDDRGSDNGIYPALHKTTHSRISFTDWYEEWLTENLSTH